MNFIKWGESVVQKMKFWDIAVFKLYLFLIGAIVGAYLANYVKQYVIPIIVVIVLCLIWLVNLMFFKKK